LLLTDYFAALQQNCPLAIKKGKFADRPAPGQSAHPHAFSKRHQTDTMAQSLTSLWLESITRVGKAQRAQGRKRLTSMMPPPGPRTKTVKATPF
jgi:hypothetical protein